MPTDLGDFLRAMRGRIRPDEVGLPLYGRRRVAGLRREEVATLAGVSVDYYTQLEQGRERSASTQVLRALADVLLLDDDGRLHLYRLAGYSPSVYDGSLPEEIDPDLVELIDEWSTTPVCLVGRAFDVLYRNELGAALWAPLTYSPNLLLNVFLDPLAKTFYRRWRGAAEGLAANFRLLTSGLSDDPRVQYVLDELRSLSPDFEDVWSRGEARGKGIEVGMFAHPVAGDLTLQLQAFDVRGSAGQQLVAYHAAAGSESAARLASLARAGVPLGGDSGY